MAQGCVPALNYLEQNEQALKNEIDGTGACEEGVLSIMMATFKQLLSSLAMLHS